MNFSRMSTITALIFAGTTSYTLAQGQEDFTEPQARTANTIPSPGLSDTRTEPLTLSARYKWAAKTSVSPMRLAGYSISSAWSTMTNKPVEYGPHWDGFGRRVASRIENGATGIMMEASVGALWNEDPRYVRASQGPLGHRLFHVAKMTFLARNRDGEFMPAYARYISVPGNSFLSNAWRPDSEADTHHAVARIPMAFLNRAIGNLFTEFWPDATKWLHRK